MESALRLGARRNIGLHHFLWINDAIEIGRTDEAQFQRGGLQCVVLFQRQEVGSPSPSWTRLPKRHVPELRPMISPYRLSPESSICRVWELPGRGRYLLSTTRHMSELPLIRPSWMRLRLAMMAIRTDDFGRNSSRSNGEMRPVAEKVATTTWRDEPALA